MNLKPVFAAVLLASGASAFAVGPGPLGTIDNMPMGISNTVAPGIFSDIYSFTLMDPGSLSGVVSAINFAPYNILGLTVKLQDSSFAYIGSSSTPSTGFTFSGLAAGNYALSVLGYATGTSGGFYAGGFSATTAPVPEPQTYAMMLGGLGVMGFVAFRRRNNQA